MKLAMNRHQGQTVTPQEQSQLLPCPAVGFEFPGLAEIRVQLDHKIDSVTRVTTRNPVAAQ
jgi:hypothetical protein